MQAISLQIIFLLSACSSAEISVLGVKEFQFNDTGDAVSSPKITSKSDGILQYAKEGPGQIQGKLISNDSALVVYALVSICEKKEDYRQEVWQNFYADKHGNFKILNIPYGNYKLASSNVNAYLSVKNDVEIHEGKSNLNITIELKPIPIEEE